jgi:SAM-dependent methyltransferase
MLDIGVGGGRTTRHFAPLVHSYIGVDLSERMVRVSRRRFPRERFEMADVRALPFADSSFDFVLFSFNGLDYVPPEDRRRALREIRRVGRAGGWFCFSAHNLLWLSRKTPRAWLVRRMNDPDLVARDEAVLQDGALLFGLSTYYVRPSLQIEQLREAGFGDVRMFGAPSAVYLYYLCRME